jgi:hypothetical protein
MEAFTNEAALSQEDGTITIVRRPVSTPQQKTESTSALDKAFSKPIVWKLQEVLTPLKKEPPQKFEISAPPPYVHSFVSAVAAIPGIKCVVAEYGEQGAVSITTFAETLTEEKRSRIYAVEVETIRANPKVVFDFHVRVAEEVSGSVGFVSGKHYFAIWGELDAQRS